MNAVPGRHRPPETNSSCVVSYLAVKANSEGAGVPLVVFGKHFGKYSATENCFVLFPPSTTMPVIVSEDGERPGGRLTVVPISHISTDVNHDHHSVTGRLVHKGPLVSSSIYDFILKAAIEEGNSSPQETSSINLVLLGALASDFSQFVNQGDVVTASGFLVSKSPTAQKDKRHACNLLLSGDQAFIHVLRSPPHDLTSPGQAKRKKRFPPAAVASPTKSTYVRIAELKPGAVVNVYGVVVFFKQPFKSRGSDFCYSLKITDQSQQNIVCTIFCPKLELLPQIFRIGDIVRLHRVKTKMYKDSLNLVNWFGFSALTFNGTVGAEMNPRTSSKTFHFTEEDRRIVTELRSWVAGRDLLPPDLTVPLSAAKPGMYFNLTCQLLAKAPVNITCTLLRVWDGTRCPHALLEVTVDADVVEGPRSFPEEHEKLIANVLVFDNHVQSVQQLKPGDFLRIFNLRAIAGCVKVPGLTSSQVGVLNHLSFHLHGGTAYGRGVRLLPDDSPEVQELKRLTEAVQDDTNINDSALWDVWKTPPETPEREASAEFRTGSTLQEARHLAATYRNVVPVRSSPGGHLAPLDLSAPFIFRGRKSFYGCKRCSKVAAITEPTADGDKTIDEKIIAEAFGIHLLKWVLVLEFRLQDAGGTLDAYLWRDAESFFNVLAEDAAADQEAQDRIQRTMDWICPPEGSAGERPWLDLCLAAYQTEDGENGKEQTSYQICHTSAPSHQHLQL
ncbi:protection of telomeres protein 1 isoform X3 [Syngnathoides biaculeatus]|uniref:protection of telomeres protein 1 isoform X3 n=1 Tax=Syngnathoides biaculeatus TaxID=300417 RepID=UPI002ADDB596|nr:protection of telomeres protein 1 isoform X3 [Syngnathoides biaculeatus]